MANENLIQIVSMLGHAAKYDEDYAESLEVEKQFMYFVLSNHASAERISETLKNLAKKSSEQKSRITKMQNDCLVVYRKAIKTLEGKRDVESLRERLQRLLKFSQKLAAWLGEGGMEEQQQRQQALGDDGGSDPPTVATKEVPPADDAAPATVRANATLLKAGTTESIWNKLGGGEEDTDMPVSVAIEGDNLVITKSSLGGGAAAPLQGGATRHVVQAALQAVLRKHGVDELPEKSFSDMSTNAMAEAVIDITSRYHS